MSEYVVVTGLGDGAITVCQLVKSKTATRRNVYKPFADARSIPAAKQIADALNEQGEEVA